MGEREKGIDRIAGDLTKWLAARASKTRPELRLAAVVRRHGR
ncbi:hypothetical protein ABZZ20_35790 [Streptomyces sp. NPDC006430]